ncbi:Stp1/IreP family PP2C-type Ser/Thr phosphatase [Vulgatibacter incomptus]|uniref:Serine/threonine phosphatase PrpC n=1 Tax=Vulgatibacter incomptus TaxID=1391653 RepID=A0A0K1P9U7_9BACT|nr:Stp1/IreP family PP2C-type Ser/Thr phosphatase [Vulgatibacter incomptus]AKU90272.1 serine/threonine phosphatase PrpC [Vulgatibacter incomptus]
MNLEHCGRTDVGRVRDHNEDSFLENEALGLFVVADGMGGHAAGEVASRLAAETIENEVRTQLEVEGDDGEAAADLAGILRDAVEVAGARVYHQSKRNPAQAGMGTTATALLVRDGKAVIGHVGDSRAYLWRDGELRQLTDDHSLVAEQVRAGLLLPDEARHSRLRNIITRSVGVEEHVEVDVRSVDADADSLFLLCSDGLTNLVDDDEIAEAAQTLPVDMLPSALVDLANERGGDDNITVIVVRVGA